MKDITLHIDGTLLENLHPPDSLTVTTTVEGLPIILFIVTDELDALDSPGPGEILIYLERTKAGFALDMDAGPGLQVKEWFFEENGTKSALTVTGHQTEDIPANDVKRVHPTTFGRENLLVGIMLIGGLGTFFLPRPWSMPFAVMLGISIFCIVTYWLVAVFGGLFK